MAETFWLILTVILCIFEWITINLVTLWFAIGSLAALIACAFGAKFWLQIVVFIIVSILCLILLKPIAKKYLKVEKIPTNADRIIKKEAIVIEEIDNVKGKGQIVVDGAYWSAKAINDDIIPIGTKVFIETIEGAKAIVSEA